MIKPLQDTNLIAPLLEAGWHHDAAGGSLHKTYRFHSFRQAFGWLTQAALWAEAQNHHPALSIDYQVVTVRLTTHDAGGLTERDITLAEKLDGIRV